MDPVIFHAKECLDFIRTVGGEDHGSVTVRMTQGGSMLTFRFTPAEWASVVATMSALGETGTTFRMFEAMQK